MLKSTIRCIKSWFFRFDVGVIDAGRIFVRTNCSFTEYYLVLFSDNLDSEVKLSTHSSLRIAIRTGNKLPWYYHFTDETRTTLCKD